MVHPGWAARPAPPSLAFLARDVYADGLLDGSRLGTNSADRGPGAGPMRLKDLEDQFAPVLRLAELTAHHRRTLRQAAVRFATHWPWVAAALVPMPPVDQWPELRDAWSTPDLTDAELEQVFRPHRRAAGRAALGDPPVK